MPDAGRTLPRSRCQGRWQSTGQRSGCTRPQAARFRAPAFCKDGNADALATLDLFERNPKTFEGALTVFVGQALAAHPGWADDVRMQLADPSLQEIIARNGSIVERVRMSGTGTQRIEADDSYVGDIDMRS